eukprot:CAMPEP_0177663440 /NCGR_PEP_ID=MMETSP0447-20121125/19913_1 /TAXON_ID=0 /ORGANISM="Stygamoeba regulata, Strain BSH-02190019" /LENGTH=332 /DNA_ID=CAMNT_0019169249 /DNA_START=52 /DNA_END=1050 /DNA_ORIENTATION=-
MDTSDENEGSSSVVRVMTDPIHGGDTLDVFLHPLVMMNIADQFTRMRILSSSHDSLIRVYGALVGVKVGRRVEIANSYEVVETQVGGKTVLDIDYLNTKRSEVAKVFPPNWDTFIGWYTTGEEASEDDLEVYRQVAHINENPLFLVLNPNPPAGMRELPLSIYEVETHLISSDPSNANLLPTHFFAPITFRLETEDSERIAVEHVASSSMADEEGGSKATEHLEAMRSAIRMLHSRVSRLQQYLSAVEKGELPRDEGILRQVHSLCNQLPAIDTEDFRTNLLTEYNDTLLVTYLAAITKGTSQIDSLATKFSVTQDRSGGSTASSGSSRHFE